MDAAIKLLLMALLMGLFLAGVPSHCAKAHDIYTDWKIPGTGISCCSEMDCAPAEAEFRNGQWFAQRPDGKWLAIPPEKVLTDGATPDGKAHLCAPKPLNDEDERVYCFRPAFIGG